MTPRRRERQTGRMVHAGGRETDLRRGPATREQRRTVLVTTNGESTERAYFEALKREPWVSVRVAVAVERGSPVDLVRGTYRRQQENDYDEAWAVCDVDHYSPGEASETARASGVRLADWDKTALNFDSFRDGVATACQRAARLDPPPAGNPSTSVGDLVTALQRSS